MCETTDPTNAEIARVLDRIADLLEGMGENPHRIRAYRDAASGVRDAETGLARRTRSEVGEAGRPGTRGGVPRVLRALRGFILAAPRFPAAFPMAEQQVAYQGEEQPARQVGRKEDRAPDQKREHGLQWRNVSPSLHHEENRGRRNAEPQE